MISIRDFFAKKKVVADTKSATPSPATKIVRADTMDDTQELILTQPFSSTDEFSPYF